MLFVFLSVSLFGQKIISYKYVKEHEGKDLFGGRVVLSSTTDYKKAVSTTFIFDLEKKIIKINNKIYEIEKRDDYHYEHDKIVNGVLYMNDKTSFVLTLLPKFEGDDQDAQILIKYQTGVEYRYYVNPSQWKMPTESFFK